MTGGELSRGRSQSETAQDMVGAPVGGVQAFPASRRPWGVWFFLGLVGASLLALVATPWPLAAKLYAAAHGLCAQRPSHSFAFGGVNLPFDARMTGIYGGVVITGGFLLARGRSRAVRPPRLAILVALGLFVAVMGADGVNSTLQDFKLPYLYEPDNRVRLATGLLMGTTVAVALGYLLNWTLWTAVADTPLLRGWRELGAILALHGLFFGAVASGWGALYLPVALTIVGGAVAVVLAIALAMLVLIYGRENRFTRPADLAGFASAALLLGYAAMATLAALRFYLERVVGLALPT